MVWSLEAFADIDFLSKSYMLARKQRQPHKTKAVELLDEGIRFPLKSVHDRVNFFFYVGRSKAD